MNAPLRVLVVDDSTFMRGAVTRLLDNDTRFEVCGQAKDGLEAVELASGLSPDLITMDFNMPGLNGADATRAILAERPVPIIMLSAHTKSGAAETVDALTAGAVDFVEKPDGEVSINLSDVREDLIRKLLTAAGAKVLRTPPTGPTSATPIAEAPPSRRALRSAARQMPPGLRVVVIASSTGGPAALVRVLPTLRLAEHAALLIVQHMPAGFTTALADQFSEQVGYAVREAQAGDALKAGLALVAPGGSHLVVERSGRVSLSDAPPIHGVKPAADMTLKSAAQAYGARTVGVVLTGMGRDGTLGLAAVKTAGGRTLAQDRGSCTVYGMPRAAVEMGVVDEVVVLDHIGSVISKLVS